MMDVELLKRIIEGALVCAGKPLSLQQLAELFPEDERPDNEELREALALVEASCEGRGFELRQVASGYRLQVIQEVAPWVGRLWEEKPQRYSRAMLETLALIAYRQPITRGDIEDIRGVAVSTQIVKTLMEREWVRVVGHKDVPGRPAMYATTRKFLDYFNLRNLDELPTLADIKDLDSLNGEFEFSEEVVAAVAEDGEQDPNAGGAENTAADANADSEYREEAASEPDIEGYSEDDEAQAGSGAALALEAEVDSDADMESFRSDDSDDEPLDSADDNAEFRVDAREESPPAKSRDNLESSAADALETEPDESAPR